VYSKYREALAADEAEWAVQPLIPYSPGDRQRDAVRLEGRDARLLAPSTQHWMGTTSTGADVASRMIHASRIALAIGLIATGISVAIGILVGGIMGYFAGWVDLLGMRLVEIFAAIPVIFLLIMIVAFYGRSLYLMMVIIGLTGWVGYALYIRAEFLKLRSMDYVDAARALGLPLHSILFKHMLPNGVTPVLVLMSFGIASAILTESTLSFLGLGLVEEPSWGQMLNEARPATGQWGLIVFPGLAIFLTVFAYNLVGEALRDALDPRAVSAGT
ncbi:MAG: ABC transporter permease, partial [Phycisphaeraceae bacterium]